MALASIVRIEVRHPYGAVLDTPVLGMVVAILNALRIRDDVQIRDLRRWCAALHIIVVMIAIVRWKMFGAWPSMAAFLY